MRLTRPVTRRAPRARAFALPLVILLALVGTIVATLILEFQGNQTRAEERSIDAYRAHHEQQGIAELLELWLGIGRPQDIPPGEALAFEIRGPAGEIYHIEVRDGQGTLLARPGPSSNPDLAPVADAYARAAEALRDRPESADLLRTHGPLKVNANAAPREVLVALARAVDPRGPAETFADQVIERRGGSGGAESGSRDAAPSPAAAAGLSQELLQRIINDAGFRDREPAELLASMLVTRSTLLRVTVAMRDPVRRIVTRHEGLVQRSVVRNQPCAFLTWRRLTEADQGQDLAPPAR